MRLLFTIVGKERQSCLTLREEAFLSAAKPARGVSTALELERKV